MSSDLTETPLTSSITISDTQSSSSEVVSPTHVAKTVRDQFFINIKTINETNSWEATCKICKATIRGTQGVTSNYNRHIKEFHTHQYKIWREQMQNTSSLSQKKITDSVIVRKVKHAGAPNSKFSSNHPRQIELEKTIIEDLIIELGLPLSLVERPSFIKFLVHVEPRFSMISRRSLTRTTIPNLYSKMMNGLNSFCSLANCLSLTLDLWSDRRQ